MSFDDCDWIFQTNVMGASDRKGGDEGAKSTEIRAVCAAACRTETRHAARSVRQMRSRLVMLCVGNACRTCVESLYGRGETASGRQSGLVPGDCRRPRSF